MPTTNPFYFIGLSIIIALIPLVLGLFTSYIKVSVVIGMVKSALGTQQVPGALVTMALSLALTLCIMSQVFEDTSKILEAQDFSELVQKPSLSGLKELLPAVEPWRQFLIQHSGKREISTLASLQKTKRSEELLQSESQLNEPEWKVLLAAFVLTELKQGFAMAFVLLLPFLVVDMIVANVLAGMGMFMVSPVMISLPLKLILFVVADGWLLLARGLIGSYGG